MKTFVVEIELNGVVEEIEIPGVASQCPETGVDCVTIDEDFIDALGPEKAELVWEELEFVAPDEGDAATQRAEAGYCE